MRRLVFLAGEPERLRRGRRVPLQPLRAGLFFSAVLLSAAAPASAALVVFEDGRTVHAVECDVRDERVTLHFFGGGAMTVDLGVVERIVDDEIDHSPPPPPSAETGPAVMSRSVRNASAKPFQRPSPFDALIAAAAHEHGIDPAFVSAVIQVESGFSPRAISRKGARGLMQLMPATARRLGVQRVFDPADNIRGGTSYLAQLAERFGETKVELILAAYNAGEAAVEQYGGVPPFRETREYVRRVLALWKG